MFEGYSSRRNLISLQLALCPGAQHASAQHGRSHGGPSRSEVRREGQDGRSLQRGLHAVRRRLVRHGEVPQQRVRPTLGLRLGLYGLGFRAQTVTCALTPKSRVGLQLSVALCGRCQRHLKLLWRLVTLVPLKRTCDRLLIEQL